MFVVLHGWMPNELCRMLNVFLLVLLRYSVFQPVLAQVLLSWYVIQQTVWMLSWFDIHQALSCYLLLHGFSRVSWSCSELEAPVIGCRWSESLLCEDCILGDCLQLLIWIWYARVIYSVIACCCCYECLVCKEVSSAIACHCWPWIYGTCMDYYWTWARLPCVANNGKPA
jgi:hypothetical protein